MSHATRRGVRRSTLAGRDKRRRLTLDKAIKELRETKSRFGLTGRPVGRRVLTQIIDRPAARIITFRHPTKRSTAGRLCFITV